MDDTGLNHRELSRTKAFVCVCVCVYRFSHLQEQSSLNKIEHAYVEGFTARTTATRTHTQTNTNTLIGSTRKEVTKLRLVW